MVSPEDRRDDPTEDLLGEIVAAEESGVALEAACAAHPALASRLRQAYAALNRFGLLSTGGGEPAAIAGYDLLAVLGRGGMGVVYRAFDRGLGRQVALKVLRPELLHFEESRQRFQREIEVVSRLRHPGIVAVYSAAEDRGVPFFTMELVEGTSLAQRIAALRGQPFGTRRGDDLLPERSSGTARRQTASWGEACVQIARMVAEALQHAHELGIFHRDVKPSNVLVDEHGRARLLDFGLARVAAAQELTKSTSMLGSLPYMAPELVEGEAVDYGARQDVYALGVMLYELLTLRSPFLRATHEATRRSIVGGDVTPPRKLEPSIARDLEVVCQKAMDRDPIRRYGAAAELAADLDNVLQHRPIAGRRTPWSVRGWRFAQRHPTASSAAALGLGLLLVSALAARSAWRAARVEREANAALVDSNVRFVTDFAQGLLRIEGATEVRLELLQQAVDQLDALEDGVDDGSRLLAIGSAQLVLADVLGNPVRPNVGRRDLAGARYRHVVEIAERVGQQAPARAALLRGNALRGLAEIARFDGALDDAVVLQRQAAEVLHPHLATEPATPLEEAVEALYLNCRSKLASLAGSQGRHDEALRGFEAVRDGERERLRRHPDDPQRQIAVAKASGAVALALHMLGQHGRAIDEMTSCIEVLDARLASVPDDSLLRLERLTRGMQLAEMLVVAERFDAAITLCARDGARCDAMLEKDAANVRLPIVRMMLRFDRGWAHLQRAEAALEDGARARGSVHDDLLSARTFLRAAQADLEALRSSGQLTAGIREDRLEERLARVDELLGDG